MDGSWIHLQAAGVTSQRAALRHALDFDSCKDHSEKSTQKGFRQASLVMKVYDSYVFRKQFRPFCAICDEEVYQQYTFLLHIQQHTPEFLWPDWHKSYTKWCRSKPPGWWSELGYTIPFFISWFSFASTWLNMMTTWSHNHVWSNYHEVIRLTSNYIVSGLIETSPPPHVIPLIGAFEI